MMRFINSDIQSPVLTRQVSALSDLISTNPSSAIAAVRSQGFLDGSVIGGGTWKWDAGLNKNLANGGTIVDPSTVGGYDGTISTRDAFLTAQGTGVGSGCWVRNGSELYSVYNFGAAADDTNDDSAAFIATQLASSTAGFDEVIVPSAKYIIDSTVSILGDMTWFFRGGQIRNLTDTVQIFHADTVNDWAFMGSITLRGTLVTTGTSTEGGLKITDCLRYKVENVTARLFKGHGFEFFAGVSVDGRAQHGQFNNCAAIECNIGWEFHAGTGSEYNVLSGCSAVECVTGVLIAAGNINWSGGNVVDNATGIKLTSGANHGHGIFSGININHNETNLRVDDVSLGHTFNGCHWYGDSASLGKIVIVNSKGITIDGGQLDSVVEILAGAATLNGQNIVRNMFVAGVNADYTGDDLDNLRAYGMYDAVGQRAAFYTPIQPTAVLGGVGFQNSWVNVGAGRKPAAFYMTESGEVALQGAIKDGTVGQIAFTLPVDYRPVAGVVELPTTSDGSFAEIFVDTTGEVSVIGGTNVNVSLEGIKFSVN